MGAHVEFPSGEGGTASGYLATPVDGGAGPALIVLGARPGLDPESTAVCDRFASEGFTALASAWGGTEGRADEPVVLGINAAIFRQVTHPAIAFLEAHPDVHGQGVGLVGLQAGGWFALELAAAAAAEVKACVLVDAPVFDARSLQAWVDLQAPVEAHVALVGTAARDEVDAAVAAAHEMKIPLDVFFYSGVAPGFFEGAASGDADAAHEAFTRSLSFLRAHLG